MHPCPICGKPVADKRRVHCSRRCAGAAKQNYKICVVCGARFACSATAPNVCCSPACSIQHRKDMWASGIYANAIANSAAARAAYYAGLAPEAYPTAAYWVIRAPGGDVYECVNLMHWLREHEDMLDGHTPRQAWDGLSKIKYSMQGKRKNPCFTWQGWSLLDFK